MNKCTQEMQYIFSQSVFGEMFDGSKFKYNVHVPQNKNKCCK